MSENVLFPVTVVGSWPRTPDLKRALRRQQEGEIEPKEFDRIADEAVEQVVKYQHDAGVDILSDGEQRRDNFYSFIVEKLDGLSLMKVSELMDYVKDRASFEETLRAQDVPAFAIKSPIALGKLGARDGLSLDEVEALKKFTSKPIKVPLPGPYQMTRSCWFDGLTDKAYGSQEELAVDVVQILKDEIKALKAAGVEYVQLDEPILSQVVYGEESSDTFMCAALSARRDPSVELDFAVRLMNEVVEDADGMNIGVHVCRGNWSRKEEVLLEGNYGPMLPHLMEMNIDQLVLEYATPRAGGLDVFKEYPSEMEIGLGVVNPRTNEIESTEYIVSKVKDALQYFEPEKIYLNPDCGFGTFAERAVNDPETSFLKMKAISEAAEVLRKEYA